MFKVGDKVWLFSKNRRVYDKKFGSAPIYSEHFYQAIIEAETSQSFIINGEKFAKKNLFGLYTDEQKIDKIWRHENQEKIKEKIEQCSIEILKQIDTLLKGDTNDRPKT